MASRSLIRLHVLAVVLVERKRQKSDKPNAVFDQFGQTVFRLAVDADGDSRNPAQYLLYTFPDRYRAGIDRFSGAVIHLWFIVLERSR